MKYFKLSAGILLAILMSVQSGLAEVKFKKSKMKLFETYVDLEVEPSPFIVSAEYYVYGITKGCKDCDVVYVLMQNHNGINTAWKSFVCDVAFEVLKTSKNGFYDILCTSRNPGGDAPFKPMRYQYNGDDYVYAPY
ncbi:MAG: hypothetical protein JKY49_17665 [Cohaesibacteraceae bacterium]|nr:hypothetical protein [Cohaesibacteraceae bacterium]